MRVVAPTPSKGQGAAAQKKRDVRTQVRADREQRLGGDRSTGEVVQCSQNRGSVGRSPTQTSAGWNVLGEKDADAGAQVSGEAIGLGCPEGEVVRHRPRVGARDLELDRVTSQFDGQLIGEVNRLQERLELVKAIGSEPEYAEQKVDLGWGTDSNRLGHEASAVRTSPSDSPIFQA